MIEHLLINAGPGLDVDDDYALPYPAGTPYKGVARAANFITGDSLAIQIGLTAGSSLNSNAGWLHFVEDNGYNIYIAKKPLRANLNWQDIQNAQVDKEIVIGDKTFLVEFISGMRTMGQPALPANAGGAWNRYIYNVYAGERADELPASRQDWGSYTEKMLGIPKDSDGTIPFAGFCWVKETANGGHATRGVSYNVPATPNVMGVWYGMEGDVGLHYAWRPMLVEKGTTPPIEIPDTPFKGLVQSADFISGTALATAVDLPYTPEQVLVDEVPWMKIVEDGTTYYVAQKSVIGGKSRIELEDADLLTGVKTVVIGGLTYKVRVMTGDINSASEWNRWMYYLYDGSVSTSIPPLPEVIDRWANFDDATLNVTSGGILNGDLSYISDYLIAGVDTRGYPNITSGHPSGGTSTILAYGWRPVLELVP